MSRSWQGGSTRAWRVLRARILQANLLENQGKCQLNLPGVCTQTADTVHHTMGRAITGDDPKHLVATCTPCNLKIGQPSTRTPPHRVVTQW